MKMVIDCIRGMIKRAKHSANLSDDGNYSVGQSTYFGKPENYEMIFPYGFSANPRVNSLVLLMNVMGQEQNLAGFVNDPPNRFKDLKPGEVQVGNLIKRQSIKFAEDGTIIIDTPESNVIINSANDVNINAAVNININAESQVNINASGDVTIDGNNLTIESDTEINGSLVVNGEITDTTGKKMSEIITAYNGHAHISNGPGNLTNPTDTPV